VSSDVALALEELQIDADGVVHLPDTPERMRPLHTSIHERFDASSHENPLWLRPDAWGLADWDQLSGRERTALRLALRKRDDALIETLRLR
jgi:hypothetical protein